MGETGKSRYEDAIDTMLVICLDVQVPMRQNDKMFKRDCQ